MWLMTPSSGEGCQPREEEEEEEEEASSDEEEDEEEEEEWTSPEVLPSMSRFKRNRGTYCKSVI